jgi:signal transduction histidine kinase
MLARLNLFQKGLLLIAAPLVVQATFLGLLIHSQFAALESQEWALHTKQVIAKVSDIDRMLSNACTSIGVMLATASAESGSISQAASQGIGVEISQLETLVSDNRRQANRVREFAQETEPILRWLESQEELVAQARFRDARDRMQVGMRTLDELHATIAAILAEEESLDRTRMEALRRRTTRLTRTAMLGGSGVLASTLVLSLLFFDGMLKRLAVLRENAGRFTEGTELRAPLGGRDEISEVDHAFHEMAEKLTVQKQENELFVYSVSHDLRSPLVNLQGFSDELSRSCGELKALFVREDVPAPVRERGQEILTGNVEESIYYIHTAVGRLGRIIDALLQLSRAGRVVYRAQLASVSSIVTRIIDALHDSIDAKGAEISVGQLPPAWGDPTAIEKIFGNLIVNAVQYLEPGRPGRIEIGAVESDGLHVADHLSVYFVKDNGLGIPDRYQDRIFTPFNRLHPTVGEGEGVGLALVAKVAQRLGVRIWLESTAGVGSTFFVGLPTASEPKSKINVDEGSRCES